MDHRRKDERAIEMYRLYESGASLAQVAVAFNVSRQSVYGLLHSRGAKLRSPRRLTPIQFNGHEYTLSGKGGYYRRTDGPRSLLHRDVWEYYHGLIPDGWDVHHQDENKQSNDPDNLECLPKPNHTSLHHPQECLEERRCLACGASLKRRISPSGIVEGPAAFRQRFHCNVSCTSRSRKGVPRGSKIIAGRSS